MPHIENGVLSARKLNLPVQTFISVLGVQSGVTPELGDGGFLRGWYYRVGQLVVGETQVWWGDPNRVIGTGIYTFTLPVPIMMSFYTLGAQVGVASVLGQGYCVQSIAAGFGFLPISVMLETANTVVMHNPGQGHIGGGITWTKFTRFNYRFSYLTDEP